MISAIVFGPDEAPGARGREIAVRSLSWLVSAVVAGVVRDVTVAVTPDWTIADAMEHAGCGLVTAADERDRLAAAAASVKCRYVLVMRIGLQPEGPLVEELHAFGGPDGPTGDALLHAAPAGLLQRILPDRAPVVGVLLPTRRLGGSSPSFRDLARSARGGRHLRTRLGPIV